MSNTELELSHKLAIAKLIEAKMELILDLQIFEAVTNPDAAMIEATNETRSMIAEMTEAIESSSRYTLAA